MSSFQARSGCGSSILWENYTRPNEFDTPDWKDWKTAIVRLKGFCTFIAQRKRWFDQCVILTQQTHCVLYCRILQTVFVDLSHPIFLAVVSSSLWVFGAANWNTYVSLSLAGYLLLSGKSASKYGWQMALVSYFSKMINLECNEWSGKWKRMVLGLHLISIHHMDSFKCFSCVNIELRGTSCHHLYIHAERLSNIIEIVFVFHSNSISTFFLWTELC